MVEGLVKDPHAEQDRADDLQYKSENAPRRTVEGKGLSQAYSFDMHFSSLLVAGIATLVGAQSSFQPLRPPAIPLAVKSVSADGRRQRLLKTYLCLAAGSA